jgi:hypothetical protein
MQQYLVLPTLLVAALTATSCGDTEARINAMGPSPFGGEALGSVSAFSSVAVAQPVRNPLCPSVAPFSVPVGVVVQANSVDIFVTEIRMQFTDTFGVPMPQVTLPAPVMTTQFGTALVQARSARSFPLNLHVGCTTARSGILIIVVDTRDNRGRRDSGQVRVTVR